MFRNWQVTPIAAAIVASTTLALGSGLTDHQKTCEDTVNQPHRLRISIVSGSSVDEAVLERARIEVEDIWRQYQLEIVWTSDATETDESESELVLQFIEGLPTHSEHALAWVLFQESRPLPYLRVSLAAAVRLMMASSWFDGQPLKSAPLSMQRMALGRILGRAIAHEIGHVILKSREHAHAGLMRAMIEPRQLVLPGLDYFGLETADIRTLRNARLARCEFARASLAAVW
jgi:hypothetical protein